MLHKNLIVQLPQNDTAHYRGSLYGPRTTYNEATYARGTAVYPPEGDYIEGYPEPLTVMVPRVVYEEEEETYQVPRLVIETATRVVPRTRRVMETRTRMVREPTTVLEERQETVQVPRIEMVDVTIQVPKTVFDTKERTVKVPTTVMAERAVTYSAATDVLEYKEEVYEIPRTIYETKTRTKQASRVIMEPKVVAPLAVTYQRPVTTTRIEYVPRIINETKMETETKYFYPGQTGAATMAAATEAFMNSDTRGKYFSHTTAAMREADVKVPPTVPPRAHLYIYTHTHMHTYTHTHIHTTYTVILLNEGRSCPPS